MAGWWLLGPTVVLSAALALALAPLARKADLVDLPGGRKLHDRPTPLTGGLAVYFTLALVLGWTAPADRFLQALAAAGALLLLLGLATDGPGLPAWLRLLVQAAACALVAVWTGVRLDGWSSLLTVLVALAVIGAYRRCDGLDGLAGALYLIPALGMALLAGLAGQLAMLWLLLVSMAAVLGFMLLNARFPWNARARVFLGDGGALLLGFLLAWCLLRLASDYDYVAARACMPITAAWLVAVPLLDASSLAWRRWRTEQPAPGGEQQRLHHAFLRAGFSVGQAWLGVTAAALLLSGAGLAFELARVPGSVSAAAFLGCAVAYHLYLRDCWDKQRFLGRNFIYNDFGPEEL